MPFADDEKKTKHFDKHGTEMFSKSNEVTAAIMRILIRDFNTNSWDANTYEKLGDWVLENGTPYQGSGGEGKYVHASDKPEDGVFIAGYRKSKGSTILTTLFHADSIESKFVRRYLAEQ